MRFFNSLAIALAASIGCGFGGSAYEAALAYATPREMLPASYIPKRRGGKTGSGARSRSQAKRRIHARRQGLHTKRRGQRLRSVA